MSAYGSKLDPYRKLREPLGVKGIRQSVVVTNNPSTIDQNQQLLVRFPNLGSNNVIVPRTARLAFTIELTSKDPNATVYQNLGRAIVKKTTIKISHTFVHDASRCFQGFHILHNPDSSCSIIFETLAYPDSNQSFARLWNIHTLINHLQDLGISRL